ncbi:ATP-binding protein [Cellulosilyticum sp. I15G10I2]|uniref:ATP-binding protein n=1 Tax=Cellulosilyticum sp. I15G10I2 TaxID=1892843 RepID=UPI00085CAE9D|nr:ATP-binding protein [Cellulosilyticum sp. I15G10I2]
MIKTPLFWSIIFLISSLIDWTALKILIDSNSLIKIPTKRYYQLFSVMVGAEFLLNVFDVLPILKVIIIIIMTWGFYQISYHVSWVKNSIVTAVFWMLSLGSEGIMLGLITRLYRLESHMSLLEPGYIKLLFFILAKVLFVSVVLVYQKLKISIDNDQHDIIYILLPLAANSLVLIFIFEYAPKMAINTQNYYSMILGMTLLIVLANVSLVVMIRKMTRDYQVKLAYKSYEDKKEAEYSYYMQLEKEHEQVRQLYHDMNNHIECIKGLVQDKEQLRQYIQSIEEEIPSMKQVFQTGSKVVDTLFRQKSIVCEKERIDLLVNLDLTRCSFIEPKDLCSIFANALDNAIEACQNIKSEDRKRYIHIEGSKVKRFLVIKIKNPKEHPIKLKGEKIITHKKDEILHGLGLKNIRRCVEKYESELVLQHTENEFYLKIVIPLNASDNILDNKNDILNNKCIKV